MGLAEGEAVQPNDRSCVGVAEADWLFVCDRVAAPDIVDDSDCEEETDGLFVGDRVMEEEAVGEGDGEAEAEADGLGSMAPVASTLCGGAGRLGVGWASVYGVTHSKETHDTATMRKITRGILRALSQDTGILRALPMGPAAVIFWGTRGRAC